MAFNHSTLEGLKVLAVDDNEDTCDLITIALELQAVEVTAVNCVSEALEVFADWQPDVIISDIAMPDEDGYSFMQRLRTLDGHKGGQVPAIALTAYVGKAAQQQALEAGFQRYIAKPLEPEGLIAAIADLVADTSLTIRNS
ncbi:MAG: response regulator [Cyanobacteriota bacterium]